MTPPKLMYSTNRRADQRLRAAIYCRVSKDQQNGASVAQQEKHNRVTVEYNNWELVDVYVDNDRPGGEQRRVVRADWDRLIRDLVAGKIDIIVVWEPSRATRDGDYWPVLAKMCVAHEVLICAQGVVYDPSDADQRFVLDIVFAAARHETAKTATRVKRSVSDRALEGTPAPGKAPFGYRRTYNTTTKKLEAQFEDIEPREWVGPDGVKRSSSPAQIMRDIFARVSSEEATVYGIAAELNSQGVPNPRTLHALQSHPGRARRYSSKWNPRVIRNMLRNHAYLGSRYYLGTLTAADKWPALATKDQFNAITIQMAKRTLKSPRAAAQVRLLSGIMTCPVCDLAVSSSADQGHPTYRCISGHVSIRIDVADGLVSLWIVHWIMREENRAELLAATGSSEQLAEAKEALLQLQSELAEAEADVEKGEITLAVFKSFYKVHKQKLDEAETRVATLGLPPALHTLAAAKQPAEEWAKMSLGMKRSVIDCLLSVQAVRVGRQGRHLSDDQRVNIQRKL